MPWVQDGKRAVWQIIRIIREDMPANHPFRVERALWVVIVLCLLSVSWPVPLVKWRLGVD